MLRYISSLILIILCTLWLVYSQQHNENALFVGNNYLNISYVIYNDSKNSGPIYVLFSYKGETNYIDYRADTHSLGWSSWGAIKMVKLNNEIFGAPYGSQKLNERSSIKTIHKYGWHFKAFSIDWIHNTIYYVFQEEQQLMVASFSVPEKRAILLRDLKENVGTLKVDPINQYLLWTQWDTPLQSVELMRSNLDGSQQITLLQTPGPVVYKFSIDSSKREIYIFNTTLYIMDFDGQHIRTVDNIIKQTDSVNIELDFCGHRLFIAHMKNSSVTIVNTSDREFSISELYLTSQSIDSFKVVHTSCQTVVKNGILLPDQCLNNNCSHICVPVNNTFYTCLCPLHDKSCIQGEIFRVNYQLPNSTPIQQTDYKFPIFVMLLLLLSIGSVTAYYFKYFRNSINIAQVNDETMMCLIKNNSPDLDIQNLRYDQNSVIGSGSFGTVVRGTLSYAQCTTNVAIKSLNKVMVSEEHSINFIEDDLRLKDLNHPNVLRLIGTCFNGTKPLIVMPYMENGDLLTYIRNKSSLTIETLLSFGAQVSNGMVYLSHKNIVHINLAARNCMLDQELNVKIADFGLSRDIYLSGKYKTYRCGPFPFKWMAIECLEAIMDENMAKVFNDKTDVWSFGVLMWELMTRGEEPYGNNISDHQLLCKLKREERLLHPDNCPETIFVLMRKCWDKNPIIRPSFDELLNELKTFISY